MPKLDIEFSQRLAVQKTNAPCAVHFPVMKSFGGMLILHNRATHPFN
jgi:hypothetical protein